jgi:hypothetical protein
MQELPESVKRMVGSGLLNADERRGTKTGFWRFATKSYQRLSENFCKCLKIW